MSDEATTLGGVPILEGVPQEKLSPEVRDKLGELYQKCKDARPEVDPFRLAVMALIGDPSWEFVPQNDQRKVLSYLRWRSRKDKGEPTWPEDKFWEEEDKS